MRIFRVFAIAVLLAFALVVGAALISSCLEQPTKLPLTPKEGGESFATVVFATPPSLAELQALAKHHHLSIDELRLESPDLTCGFRVEGRDLAEVQDVFLAEHAKFLDYMLAHPEHQVPSMRARFVTLKAQLEVGNVVVPTVVVAAPNSRLAIPGATIRDEAASRSAAPPTSEPTTQSQNHESWAPYTGSSQVTKDYSMQWFTFNNTGSFAFARAYEHETLFQNKDYVNQTGYWSSNMPYAYLDCSNGTDSWENFAVGCKIGWSMQNFTNYYAYIAFRGQSASSSRIKIDGQRPWIYPGCFGCWCIAGGEHTQAYTDYTAPGYRAYSY